MIAYNLIFFCLFSALAAIIYRRLPAKRRASFLLSANLVFVGVIFWFEPAGFLATIFFIFLNYLFVNVVSRSSRPALFCALGVIADVLFFVVMKTGASSSWGLIDAVGFSFLFLRAVQVLVDEVSNNDRRIDFISYANFLLFFPAFLAGPVIRYQDFKSSIGPTPPLNSKQAYDLASRGITGLFKILILSRFLGYLSISYMNDVDLAGFDHFKLWLSAFIFGIVLYLGFSGSTDFAISVGGLFGVALPENFDRPYFARNIQEFWNRWHISFMSWIRLYVYVPLGRLVQKFAGGRPTLLAANTLFWTFVVVGLWHGVKPNFLWYGVYHGAGFVVFVAYRKALNAGLSKDALNWYQQSRTVRVLAIAVTWAFVTGGWFFFLDKIEFLKI